MTAAQLHARLQADGFTALPGLPGGPPYMPRAKAQQLMEERLPSEFARLTPAAVARWLFHRQTGSLA